MNADVFIQKAILEQQAAELRRILLQRINVLEQRVAELKRSNQNPYYIFGSPQISVCKSNCNFTVTGSGFLPHNIVFVHVSNDDLNRVLYQQSVDNRRKFISTRQTPCVSGLPFHFVATDGQHINHIIYQQSADNSGKFTLTQQIPYVSDPPLHFVATDGRHINGQQLWSNIFTTF